MLRIVEDHKLSLVLSAVEHFVTGRTGSRARPGLSDPHVLAATVFAEHAQAGGTVPDAPPPEVAQKLGGSAGTVWGCVRRVGQLLLAKVEGHADRAAQLEAELKDSECDPGWIETVTRYLDYFGPDGRRRTVPYVRFARLADFVYDVLPPDAVVALLGDWGTGMPPAVRLLEQIAAHQPHVLVHLGDIYYAGTPEETGRHFLDLLDRVLDRRRTRVYAIPGNHEMYSGGEAYYAALPRLGGDPPQQASYFSLRTADGAWQLLAMDTGLHDADPFDVTSGMTFLEPDELVWHVDKIDRVHAAGGRTLLLSHHQLFSPFATIGSKVRKPAGQEAFNLNLLNAFRPSLEADKVTAWFWGHEHNFAVYQPYPPLARGRLIGHGAVPVWTSQQPYRVLPGLPDPPRLVTGDSGRPLQLEANADGVYETGFAILRLQGPAAEVGYYVASAPEQPVYVERFP